MKVERHLVVINIRHVAQQNTCRKFLLWAESNLGERNQFSSKTQSHCWKSGRILMAISQLVNFRIPWCFHVFMLFFSEELLRIGVLKRFSNYCHIFRIIVITSGQADANNERNDPTLTQNKNTKPVSSVGKQNMRITGTFVLIGQGTSIYNQSESSVNAIPRQTRDYSKQSIKSSSNKRK